MIELSAVGRAGTPDEVGNGFGEEGALQLMLETFASVDSPATVTIVRYKKRPRG